jgi:hypothetical protein
LVNRFIQMISSFTTENQEGKEFLQFLHVLLDPDGSLYSFHNDFPIYVEGGGLQRIGVAQLHTKRNKLYGDLTLQNSKHYGQLFAHLLHDVYGHVFGLLLSEQVLADPSIHCLTQQANMA